MTRAKKPAPKKPAHRPSGYSDARADRICAAIAQGQPLVKACEAETIDYSTAVRWLREREYFRANYAQAREDQADWHADEVLAIADDATLTPDDRRVRIDARKWSAGKMKPKRYGDKLQTEQSVTLTVATKEQRDAAYRAALDADA